MDTATTEQKMLYIYILNPVLWKFIYMLHTIPSMNVFCSWVCVTLCAHSCFSTAYLLLEVQQNLTSNDHWYVVLFCCTFLCNYTSGFVLVMLIEFVSHAKILCFRVILVCVQHVDIASVHDSIWLKLNTCIYLNNFCVPILILDLISH